MAKKYFNKILVANRSEIAIRVMNGCRLLGIPTVAVYSEADMHSKHRYFADESVLIGPPPPRESYLNIDKLIEAAKVTGADAIHPGYGFLSENPLFSKRCADEGITFIGPPADAIKLMGNKVESRVKMAEAGVPLIPGMKEPHASMDAYRKAADESGYPVMIKAAAGGGGKGMRVVHTPDQLEDAVEAARREALNAFNDDTVYLEKLLVNPRHIEFQVFADKHGNAVHVFERECSIQRRHQKIIEETPSVAVNAELRKRMGEDAVKVALACGYVNAGTVEFLLDQSGRYFFLEMNTRLQVEHPITEMVTGVDLVVEQIRVAAGEPLSDEIRSATQRGHAIECRIYAEDGEKNFLPSSGKIEFYREPSGPGVRVDSGVTGGQVVTPDYDPIMAKLICHAPTRELAIEKMIHALNQYKILGVKTSKRFMIECLSHPEFVAGNTYTSFIEKHMQERTVDGPLHRSLAAAIATLAEVDRPQVRSGGGESKSAPTPWEMIGNWQVGESIDGKA